ncbi:MAG: response regulator transcription factor [Elusimicrobia bacterium]|nr:response regulator transcription factor [Elusimicrobiota bacterium]
MRLSTWTVCPRARAARWERLWRALGLTAPLLSRLDELPRERGLALVDLSLLGGDALCAHRAKRPGLHVVACADVGAAPQVLSAALAGGALDYFDQGAPDDALEARLRAHLKRLFPSAKPPGLFSDDGLRLDARVREVHVRRGKSWKLVGGLSAREFDVLSVLAGAPGKAFERRDLLDRLGSDAVVEAVDKVVAALRKKLGTQGKRLKTLRGVGYLLAKA